MIKIRDLLFVLLLIGVPACGPAGERPESREVSSTATAAPPPSATQPAATATARPVASPSPAPAVTINAPSGVDFEGVSAMAYLEAQMAFGPRWPGSPGHAAAGDYIAETLQESGWAVENQYFPYQDVQGRNIIGRANEGVGPVVIIGAHYDTRRVADETPGGAQEMLAVPGAVDGASGVAVLLELARTLDLEQIPREVWLTFFDLEDNGSGGLPGWDWIVGSTYMVDSLAVIPEAVVVVDMVGDADQRIYYEGSSDPALRQEIWEIAAELGYGAQFVPRVKYHIIDDHTPFVENGIRAVDIIDFDYPYWHTVEDTIDKASAESLERVGRTLEVWLEQALTGE